MTTSIASRRFWRKNGVWPLPVLKAVFGKVGVFSIFAYFFIGAPILTYAVLGSVGGFRFLVTIILSIFCVILAWCIFSDIRMYALLRPKGFLKNVYMFFCGRYIVRARSLYRYRIFARGRDYSVLGIFGNVVFMPLFHLYVISWMYILWFIGYAVSETAALGVLNQVLEFANPVIEFFSFFYLVDFLNTQQNGITSKILLFSYIYFIVFTLLNIVVSLIFVKHMDLVNNKNFAKIASLKMRLNSTFFKLFVFWVLIFSFSLVLTIRKINEDEFRAVGVKSAYAPENITETHFYVFLYWFDFFVINAPYFFCIYVGFALVRALFVLRRDGVGEREVK